MGTRRARHAGIAAASTVAIIPIAIASIDTSFAYGVVKQTRVFPVAG